MKTKKEKIIRRTNFFDAGSGGGRSADSRASLAVPLSRRGGRTQTQLPSLLRPFDPLTNLNKKKKVPLFNFLRLVRAVGVEPT